MMENIKLKHRIGLLEEEVRVLKITAGQAEQHQHPSKFQVPLEVRCKATLIGACFLIDYMFFEKRQTSILACCFT